jgi:hypothetical protein
LFFIAIFTIILWFNGAIAFNFPTLTLILVGALGLALIPLALQFLKGKNTEYVITDKRVIIQSGVFGKGIRFVDLNNIQEAHVEKGLKDSWFKTGSILILTAGQTAIGNIGGDTVSWEFGPIPKVMPGFSAIREPYEVLKLLQDAIENSIIITYKLKNLPKKDVSTLNSKHRIGENEQIRKKRNPYTRAPWSFKKLF